MVLSATVHVYVVLAGTISVPLLGVTVNGAPLQIVADLLAITGFGLMVILKVAVVPVHATVLFV